MSEKRPGIDKVVEFLRQSPPPRIVIDLGAHQGKTVNMWLDAGAERVIAVEPVHANWRLLEYRYNADARVDVVLGAVAAQGCHSGPAILFVPDDVGVKDKSQGASLFRGPVKQKKRDGKIEKYHKEVVPLMSLDMLMHAHGMDAMMKIPYITLLKVNIEGAEYDALRDVPLHLIDSIFISWHNNPPFNDGGYPGHKAGIIANFKRNAFRLVSKETRGDHDWDFWVRG